MYLLNYEGNLPVVSALMLINDNSNDLFAVIFNERTMSVNVNVVQF